MCRAASARVAVGSTVTTSLTMTSRTFFDHALGPRPRNSQAVARPATSGVIRVARMGHAADGGALVLSRVESHRGAISSYSVLVILTSSLDSTRRQPWRSNADAARR